MTDKRPSAVATAKSILEAFNPHDLDRVMSYFAGDCTLDMPRGAEPWGERLGKAAVREGLSGCFKGLPDVHYGEDRHWGDGNMIASEWLLTGTRPDGERVRVCGCDHYEFSRRKSHSQGLLSEDRPITLGRTAARLAAVLRGAQG